MWEMKELKNASAQLKLIQKLLLFSKIAVCNYVTHPPLVCFQIKAGQVGVCRKLTFLSDYGVAAT